MENSEYKCDSLPPSEFGNAVKISTVHNSKGLEFPVVFVARTDAIWQIRGGTKDVNFDKNLGLGIKLFNPREKTKMPSVAYTAVEIAKKRREVAENIRLLYVALTRAKEYLFITGAATPKTVRSKLLLPPPLETSQSFLDLLLYAGAKDGEIKRLIDMPAAVSQAVKIEKDAPKAVFNKEEKLYSDTIKRVVDFQYPYAASTAVSPKYTVSALNRTREDDAVYIPSVVKEDNRGAGIAYHTVMEHIDLSLSTESEVNMFIVSLAERGILTQTEAELVDGNKIFKCISTPLIREGIKEKYLREQSFMLRVPACEALDTVAADHVLVQGTVDLCFLGKENVLIDFKYSSLPDDALAEKYKKQLNMYEKAVEVSFGVKIHKKLIYSFISGNFVEIN